MVRELRAEAHAEVLGEVGVGAPVALRDGAAVGLVRAVEAAVATGGAEAEALFFGTAVADEGAEDEGVGDGGGGQDLQGGEEGAELLV